MNEIEILDKSEALRRRHGSNLVEYSMLMALIVVVCLAAMTFFGSAATSQDGLCVDRDRRPRSASCDC